MWLKLIQFHREMQAVSEKAVPTAITQERSSLSTDKDWVEIAQYWGFFGTISYHEVL